MKSIAAVTGATGLVGKRIVELLLANGISVRILTRNTSFVSKSVEVHYGDLSNTEFLEKFLDDANYLFHCAAELQNESKMWETNVTGAINIIGASARKDLKYICYLSSVGVMGRISGTFADESTPCEPINRYEKTKYEAEKFMMEWRGSARAVVLRPTNVIDETKNEIINIGKIKLFIKGGENAHLIHAKDVAHAAVYFMNKKKPTIYPECYIVSCDDDPMNTIAGCWALFHNKKLNSKMHLPWLIPYFLRRLAKGSCNRGDLRYSSKKLLDAGFNFKLGFKGAMIDIKPVPLLN